MADLLQHTVLNQCIQLLGTGLLQGLPNQLSLCNVRIRAIRTGMAFLLCLDPAQVARWIMLAITERFGIANTKFHSDELVIERLGLLLYGGRCHLIKEVRNELIQRYLDNPRHYMVAICRCWATARRARLRGGSARSLGRRHSGGGSGGRSDGGESRGSRPQPFAGAWSRYGSQREQTFAV
jgi:hypothetical protein